MRYFVLERVRAESVLLRSRTCPLLPFLASVWLAEAVQDPPRLSITLKLRIVSRIPADGVGVVSGDRGLLFS
jgi:hypothetical protein